MTSETSPIMQGTLNATAVANASAQTVGSKASVGQGGSNLPTNIEKAGVSAARTVDRRSSEMKIDFDLNKTPKKDDAQNAKNQS